jgi:16S rRNA processing protein RimM
VAVVVARIGKAHGLKGEVTVRVHTDAPGERFVVGAVFETEPASAGPLRLRSVRDHNGILLLGFEEASDRTAAEGLRGTRLLAEEEADTEDAWYEDDLAGLTVVDVHGTTLGEVSGLESRPAQDLLVLRLTDGRTARVPFVEQLVPEVDVDGGRVVIDPPAGLLDLEEG